MSNENNSEEKSIEENVTGDTTKDCAEQPSTAADSSTSAESTTQPTPTEAPPTKSIEETLREELATTRDKYLRALAEADNISKRALKEKSELLRYAGQPFITDLLSVVDNFELALSHKAHDTTTKEDFAAGIEMIAKQLTELLNKYEVKCESLVGKDFNPNLAEALSQIPSPDTKAGTVLNEFKKAYTYRGKLIRPGQVVVASAPPATTEEPAGA